MPPAAANSVDGCLTVGDVSTLTLQGVSLSHGAVELVTDLDLTVGSREVVAVVGANGSGKTTLLRAIAGEHAIDRGVVRTSPSAAAIGLWPQTPGIRPTETAGGFIGRRTGVQPAADALEVAANGLAESRPGADGRYAAGSGALDGPRRCRPRHPRRTGVGPAATADPSGRARCPAVRWTAGPARPRRPDAQPVRRGAARRADQRSGRRRPRPPGGIHRQRSRYPS